MGRKERIAAHTHLVEQVRHHMSEAGLTGSQMSQLAGINRAELWHWLKGTRNLRSDKLLALLLTAGFTIRHH